MINVTTVELCNISCGVYIFGASTVSDAIHGTCMLHALLVILCVVTPTRHSTACCFRRIFLRVVCMEPNRMCTALGSVKFMFKIKLNEGNQ